jgi:signal transduction histidine kinase/ligand-binding sensor domain-containing protein
MARLVSTIVLLFFLGLLPGMRTCAQDFVHWHLVKNLNVANGLEQNTIRSIYFDAHTGFVWLATEGGLIRYDGVDTKSYTIRNLPLLRSSRIYGFCQTNDDHVLAIEKSGTVMEIDSNDAFIRPDLNMGWMNALDRLIRNLASIEREKNNSSKTVAYATPDFNSLVWLNDSLCLTSSATHFYIFNGTTLVHDWKKPKPGNATFLLDKEKVYILNSDATGISLELPGLRMQKISAPQDIFKKGKPQLFQFSNGVPLLFNQGKVYRIRFVGNQVTAEFLAQLPDCPDNVISLVYDPDNEQIYCGTPSNGLYIYKKSPFYTYQFGKPSGPNKQPVYNPYLDNIYSCLLLNDSLLLTSSSVLVNLHTRATKVLPAHFYNLTMATKDGYVIAWIYAHVPDGLLVKLKASDLSEEKTYPAIRNVHAIYKASNNEIWVAGTDFLYRVRGDSLIPFFDLRKLPNAPPDGFQYLFEAPRSHFIFGANANTVCRIDTAGRKVQTLFHLDRSIIRMPYIDTSGLCWVPTYGDGIYCYDLRENRLYKPSIANTPGLAHSHCFIDDGAGNFLIPTNNGLYRINREALNAACRKPGTSLVYQYFDVTNSLSGNEFNGGCSPAYNKLPNGDLLLPSLNGLVRVSPSLLSEPIAYPLFIENITTPDSLYPYSKSLNFRPSERFLNFALSFGQWDYTNFSGIYYRLDGAKDWTYLPTSDRKIRLAYLTGGNHILEIKKQFGLSGGKISTLTIPFTVGRNPSEKPVIWFLAALCFVGFIWLVAYLINVQLKLKNITLEEKIREKTAELVAKNRDLENTLLKLNDAFGRLEKQGLFQRKLIALINHDIMVPLRYISKVSTQLINYREKLSKKSSEEAIEEINTTSIGLSYLSENIIQWITLQEESYELKPSSFNLRRLVDELLILHRHLADEKGNTIDIGIPDSFVCFHDPVLVRVILHNLLLNANKFTSQGTVTVTAYPQNGEICLIINDTGMGMSPEMVVRLNDREPVDSNIGTNEETGWGIGYRLIMEMLRLSRGKMHIESARGHGTSITILLPPL